MGKQPVIIHADKRRKTEIQHCKKMQILLWIQRGLTVLVSD